MNSTISFNEVLNKKINSKEERSESAVILSELPIDEA